MWRYKFLVPFQFFTVHYGQRLHDGPFGVGLLVRVGARNGVLVAVSITTQGLCNFLCAYLWYIKDVIRHVKFFRFGFNTQGA